MLKAICIVGSARANGSCSYLVDAMIKGMNESGIETKKYCIGDMKIQYCCGQKKCYTDGKCVYNDDVKQIVEDLIAADIVVMAAPSYWAGVPGQLKVFFDRCTPYGDTDPNLKKTKKGIAIAVRAGVREAENELILDSIDHYFGHMAVETVAKVSVCQTDSLEDLLSKHQDKIEEVYLLGKKMKQYAN